MNGWSAHFCSASAFESELMTNGCLPATDFRIRSSSVTRSSGLNARGSDRPVGLAATSPIVAPKFVTADLMAEYVHQDLSYKLSLTNVTDEHYADFLYRGHYVPGKGRGVQLTAAYRFY